MMFTRRRLFLALMFLAVIAAAFMPLHAAYADNPLVPKCQSAETGAYGGTFSGACQLCDLVTLAHNLINFAIVLAVSVATLMFAYAGILYVTAASKAENIKKAHGIFINVFVGLIIILVAWLVIDLIMRTLVGERLDPQHLGPWNSFQCADYTSGAPLPQLGNLSQTTGNVSVGGGTGGGVPFVQGDETTVRAQLAGKVCVSASGLDNSNGCQVAEQCGNQSYEDYRAAHNTGCTNVGGLQPIIGKIQTIAQNCNCNPVITGGSEAGHSADSAHNDGRAVDFASNTDLAKYLHDHAQTLGISQICTPPGNLAQYRVGTTCSEAEDHIHVGF